MMKNKFKGTIFILLATVIWGSAFIAQSVGMDYISPFTFQAVRCALGAAFLLPLSRVMEKNKSEFARNWKDKQLWKTGLLAGVALFLAGGLQQVGLQYTTAGKAGFLTAMYIVLVPILGIFLGQKPSFSIVFSVILAAGGLYLLSGSAISDINGGDWMLIGCAFWFAVQITIIDRLGQTLDGVRLNCIQSLVCAALSALVMLFTEELRIENILSCWLPLGYAGVLSMGIAYTLQILGQQHLDPAPASLLMSLESVFALIFGWLILNEQLSLRELLGCGAMFCAVILSQIPKKSTA